MKTQTTNHNNSETEKLNVMEGKAMKNKSTQSNKKQMNQEQLDKEQMKQNQVDQEQIDQKQIDQEQIDQEQINKDYEKTEKQAETQAENQAESQTNDEANNETSDESNSEADDTSDDATDNTSDDVSADETCYGPTDAIQVDDDDEDYFIDDEFDDIYTDNYYEEPVITFEDVDKYFKIKLKQKKEEQRKSKSKSTKSSGKNKKTGSEFSKELIEEFALKSSWEQASLEMQIAAWLNNVSYGDFVKEITQRVVGQSGVEELLLCIYMYLQHTAAGETISSNVLVAAPSGSGKTETYRAVKEYFEEFIPRLVTIQKDMTSITEEGYKGGNTEDLIMPLVTEHTGGIGLVFLDEFDKKLVPSITSDGRDVNMAVQSQILTLIEGREIRDIDTNKTMFIGMGAFDMCRRKRKEVPKKIGFITSEEKPVEHYDEITIEDMLKLGAIPELIGRFAMVVNFQALDDNAVKKIILKTAKTVENNLNTNIVIGDKMMACLEQSANSPFGCRIFYSILLQNAGKVVKEILKEGGQPQQYKVFLTDSGQGYYEKIKKPASKHAKKGRKKKATPSKSIEHENEA